MKEKVILVQFCRFSLYLLSNFTEKRDVFRLQNPRETIQANISAVNDVNLKKIYISILPHVNITVVVVFIRQRQLLLHLLGDEI